MSGRRLRPSLICLSDSEAALQAAEQLSTAPIWDELCTRAARSLILLHTVLLTGTSDQDFVPAILTSPHTSELFDRCVVGNSTERRLVISTDRFARTQWVLGSREPSVLLACWLLRRGELEPGTGVHRVPKSIANVLDDSELIDGGWDDPVVVPAMRTLLRDGFPPTLVRATADLL
jgi:hypothetical protein